MKFIDKAFLLACSLVLFEMGIAWSQEGVCVPTPFSFEFYEPAKIPSLTELCDLDSTANDSLLFSGIQDTNSIACVYFVTYAVVTPAYSDSISFKCNVPVDRASLQIFNRHGDTMLFSQDSAMYWKCFEMDASGQYIVPSGRYYYRMNWTQSASYPKWQFWRKRPQEISRSGMFQLLY